MKEFFKRFWLITIMDLLFWVILVTSSSGSDWIFTIAMATFVILILATIEYGIYRLLKLFHLIKPKQTAKINKKYSDVAPISDDLIKHYHEEGLNDEEIKLFRQTMKEARDQIMTIEDNFTDPTLAAIDRKIPVILACQNSFKELVSEPRKLNAASEFLYHHLPNLTALSSKYIEVKRRNQISQDANDLLHQTKDTIQEMAGMIVEDYKHLTHDDILALNDEIRFAQQQMKQKEYDNER